MTVIAWDGITLAADKRADYGGAGLTVTKIMRLDDDRLVAISGTGAHGMALLGWLGCGANREHYPAPASPDDCAHVLVVHRDGRLWNYESGGYFTVLDDGQPLAMGAGRDFALGALAAGADARRAVEIANQYSSGCGNGIDTLRFE